MQEIISDIQDDNCIKPYSYDEFLSIILKFPSLEPTFDKDWYHRCLNIIGTQTDISPIKNERVDLIDPRIHFFPPSKEEFQCTNSQKLYRIDINLLFPILICSLIKQEKLEFNHTNFDKFFISCVEYSKIIRIESSNILYPILKTFMNATYGMCKYVGGSRLLSNIDLQSTIYEFIYSKIINEILSKNSILIYYDTDFGVFSAQSTYMINTCLEFLGLNFEISEIESFQYVAPKRYAINGKLNRSIVYQRDLEANRKDLLK